MITLRDELQRLYQRDGQLSPAAIVAEFEPADHPFHDRLTWNADEAAERYRLLEAAALIRSVRVVYKEATADDPARTVREFYAVRDVSEYGGGVYHAAEEIVQNPLVQDLLLRMMQRDIDTLTRRYRDVAGFFDLLEQKLAAARPQPRTRARAR